MKSESGAGKTKQVVTVYGILWMVGLLLAGSDGPYMPWVNLVGMLILIRSSFVLGQRLPELDTERKTGFRPHTKIRQSNYPLPQRRTKSVVPVHFFSKQHGKAAV